MVRPWLRCAMILGCLTGFVLGPVHTEPGRAGDDPTAGKDWPQFLGPERNGISTETGLLKTWPAQGPKAVWRVKGGVGMSGLAIKGGRLVTMLQHDGKERVVCHNAATGKWLWETAVGPEFKNSMGDGPRATPTIVDDAVYAFGGAGTLIALGLRDGKTNWKHDVLTELKGTPADYGMACSPLVVGDLVLVTVGAPGATVVAYERGSGKLRWQTGKDTAGYSSPARLHVGGREQVVVFDGQAVLGLAAPDGKELWRYDYETDFDCNIATPLAYKDQVFISSGENHGCALLGLKPMGERYTVNEIWKSQGPSSVMRNEWQTSILLDGHLYGFDNIGSAGPVTNLNCVAIDTGKLVWQKARYGKGNLMAADGKLFIVTMAGELVVARATPKGYEELGRARVLGPTRQAPALAGGRLYLRDGKEIVCLDVKE